MINQIRHIIFLLIIILAASCGKSEDEAKEHKKDQVIEKKEELQKIADEKAFTQLTSKYNAFAYWDTLETFTYVLQEMFIDENKPISFVGDLMDITKDDSSYVLKVHITHSHYDNVLALISISKERFVELKRKMKTIKYSAFNPIEGCFILKVTKITSQSPKGNSNIELSGEDSYSYLDFDFDATLLIFKGDLIDFHINK